MKYTENINFIHQTEICPNCGNDFFSSYWCKNCWYMIFENNYKNQSILDLQSNTISKIHKLLPITRKYSFVFWNFKSYKIEIFQGKIKKIYFHYNKNSFLVCIDYDLVDKKIIEKDFYETNVNDRFREYFLKKIKNIKIKMIQRKVKVWFGEIKKSRNYYKYLWLDENNLKNYIFNLLNYFHT